MKFVIWYGDFTFKFYEEFKVIKEEIITVTTYEEVVSSSSSFIEWVGVYLEKYNYDESKLVEDEIEIVVQIKGKVRAKLMVAKDLSREELQEVALANEKVKAEIDGKEIVKVISVPNKLVNIVVK